MGTASKTIVAASLASALLAASPAAARHGFEYLESDLHLIGAADQSPYDRLGTRIHRTAIEDGYFGQGARHDGRGSYDYDRGYPYDYYQDRREMAEGALDAADAAAPRDVRCHTQWTHDDEHEERVPVTVCRG